MAAQSVHTIKIFYCYAPEDDVLREELARHLSPFRRLRYITGWYNRDIQAGTEWEKEGRTHLDAAHIILLLLSADFFASDYRYTVEMEHAIRRHKAGTAHVIPILLRPVDWKETPMGQFQALPSNEKAVTQWADRDEAWLNVVQGVREVIKELLQAQPLSSEENAVLNPEHGPLSGQIIGSKYLLGNLLGEGAFSQVYQAQDIELRRQQAIKVLHEHYFRKKEFQQRFLREAQTIASLEHSNIIHLDNFGTEASRAFLVMPFVSGGTLQGVLETQQGFLESQRILFYLECICAALDYAHGKGIVHLDLKPTNLLVHEDGRLLLSDFGLAHMMKQGVIVGGSSLIAGTSHYMAPEHIQGSPEKRSDLFSLGIILYQMLVGRLPFDGCLPETVLLKNVMEQFPAPRSVRPDLPKSLENILSRAIAKQPKQRFQTAHALLITLKPFLSSGLLTPSMSPIPPSPDEDDLLSMEPSTQDTPTPTPLLPGLPPAGAGSLKEPQGPVQGSQTRIGTGKQPAVAVPNQNDGGLAPLVVEAGPAVVAGAGLSARPRSGGSDEQPVPIYLIPEDDLTSVRERLERTEARRIILVIPPQTQLRSHVGWRRIHARMRELGKDLMVVSPDRQVRAVARASGFHVAESQVASSGNRPPPDSIEPRKAARSRISNRGNETRPSSTQHPLSDEDSGIDGDEMEKSLSRRTSKKQLPTSVTPPVVPGAQLASGQRQPVLPPTPPTPRLALAQGGPPAMPPTTRMPATPQAQREPQFTAGSGSTLMAPIAQPVSEDADSPDMEAVVMKARTKDPKERFASIQECAEAFADASEKLPLHDLSVSSKGTKHWLAEGDAYFDAREAEKALIAYNEVIALDPKNTSVYGKRGILFCSLRDYPRGFHDFDLAMQLDPNNYKVSLHIIESDTSKGSFTDAIQKCQQLLKCFPEALEVYRLLGEIYLRQNNLEEAQQTFDWILTNDPENMMVYCDLALVSKRTADVDTALDCYQQAYELSRGNAKIRQTFNELSASVGQQEFMFSRAGLARLYMRGNLLTQAIQEWEAVLQISPERLDARLGLMETYWREGIYDKAEQIATQLLEEIPTCLKALLLLADMTVRNNGAHAIELFCAARNLDPEMLMARDLFSKNGSHLGSLDSETSNLQP